MNKDDLAKELFVVFCSSIENADCATDKELVDLATLVSKLSYLLADTFIKYSESQK